MTEVAHLPRLSPAAERMRRYRERCRLGHACITVELRECEIAALISRRIAGDGSAARSNRHRDRAPRLSRPQSDPVDPNSVTRNGKRVTCHGAVRET